MSTELLKLYRVDPVDSGLIDEIDHYAADNRMEMTEPQVTVTLYPSGAISIRVTSELTDAWGGVTSAQALYRDNMRWIRPRSIAELNRWIAEHLSTFIEEYEKDYFYRGHPEIEVWLASGGSFDGEGEDLIRDA